MFLQRRVFNLKKGINFFLATPFKSYPKIFKIHFFFNLLGTLDYVLKKKIVQNKHNRYYFNYFPFDMVVDKKPNIINLKYIGCKIKKLTLIRSPFVNKASKEQFESRYHLFFYLVDYIFFLFLYRILITLDTGLYQLNFKFFYKETGIFYLSV